jgi:hypothetical protein
VQGLSRDDENDEVIGGVSLSFKSNYDLPKIITSEGQEAKELQEFLTRREVDVSELDGGYNMSASSKNDNEWNMVEKACGGGIVGCEDDEVLGGVGRVRLARALVDVRKADEAIDLVGRLDEDLYGEFRKAEI